MIITFSIPQSDQDKLSTFLEENESLNLCAKRLLQQILEGSDLSKNSRLTIEEKLGTLEDCGQQILSAIQELKNEKISEPTQSESLDIEAQLTELRERIRNLEAQLQTSENIQERSHPEETEKPADLPKKITDSEAGKLLGISGAAAARLKRGKITPAHLEKFKQVGLVLKGKSWLLL